MNIDPRRALPYLSLFTSASTLLCCALPALLVSVGLGAAMAGLAANVPGLIWISEHKTAVFLVAGAMLALNGIFLYLNQNAVCPTDPILRDACLNGRKTSRRFYVVTLVIFAIGVFFAYGAPIFL
jgi:hypothetical protein